MNTFLIFYYTRLQSYRQPLARSSPAVAPPPASRPVTARLLPAALAASGRWPGPLAGRRPLPDRTSGRRPTRPRTRAVFCRGAAALELDAAQRRRQRLRGAQAVPRLHRPLAVVGARAPPGCIPGGCTQVANPWAVHWKRRPVAVADRVPTSFHLVQIVPMLIWPMACHFCHCSRHIWAVRTFRPGRYLGWLATPSAPSADVARKRHDNPNTTSTANPQPESEPKRRPILLHRRFFYQNCCFRKLRLTTSRGRKRLHIIRRGTRFLRCICRREEILV